MININSNGKDWLFVEIPEGIAQTIVTYWGGIPSIEFRVIKTQDIGHIELPKGNYLLCATTDNITEEKADMIVERVVKQDGTLVGYQDHEERYPCPLFDTALDSFPSFLMKHNLTGRYAILRKL
jgi:hypothetical protein